MNLQFMNLEIRQKIAFDRRFKNLFRDLDATHFRRMAVNIAFEVNGVHHVAELQIHLQKIFEFKQNNKDLMHQPYEYFRESGEKNKVMTKLKRQMDTMHAVVQTPVLLSLFCTTVEPEKDKLPKLPESVAELYQTAMSARLKEKGELTELLQAVALENFREGRREFTISHVKRIQLEHNCSYTFSLGPEKPIPLIKTLDSSAGLYQFAHLSFQEALVAHALHRNEIAKQDFATNHLLTRKAVNVLKFVERNTFSLPPKLNKGGLGEFEPTDFFEHFREQFLHLCRVDTVVELDFSHSDLTGKLSSSGQDSLSICLAFNMNAIGLLSLCPLVPVG
jgi:hypothetical protein